MIKISQDKTQEIEDLKKEINDKIDILTADIDEDGLEKIKKLKIIFMKIC